MIIHHDQPVVFVTGGSRGIGKAVVEKFQSQSWRVAACATTEKGAQSSGADLALVCDVGDAAQVRSTISAILSKFGRLDAVINNAGLAGSDSLDPNSTNEQWHCVIRTNLDGPYFVSKYALPYLPDNTGRIINISSVLGLQGAQDATAYCSSKHGMVGLTRALAHEVAPRRITVNAICPGWVRTDMAINRIQELGLSEENLAKSVLLGRFIEPDEVADLAFYLVTSKAAAIMTGQTITIDGGALA
ncbi:MAG: SDR family oxidoreductase [Gammaproteobacteria bacterium]|nr:SDR family oxidoreductase [Gammaproteobacteria bacterium]MCW5583947.1 SDR family oxidoreductase [Gammaproteobacteria bacterium]